MISLVILFSSCLVISAFLSAAEMAFVSANKIKFRDLADSGNTAAQRIIRLQDYPQRFLTSILIGNNLVNIIAAATIAYGLEIKFHIKNEWLATAITAPFLIILGETVPKDYGRLRSQSFLLTFAPVLDFLIRILGLPVRIILKGVNWMLSPLGSAKETSIFVSPQEFRLLIEEGVKQGILADHEKRLIDTILDFERIHVNSVMIPVEKVAKVEISETIGRVKEIARQTQSKMLLVYEEIPAIVVGMIYVFDLLFESREDRGLKDYLRAPIFVSKNTSIEKAFLTLQEKRQSFAVVTDEYSEVAGVVPMERLFTL